MVAISAPASGKDNMPKITVLHRPSAQRPRRTPNLRRKLAKRGPEALSDEELLSIVLARGAGGESCPVIARRIMRFFHPGLFPHHGLVGSLQELCRISEGQACQVLACFELGRRYFHAIRQVRLCTPEAVYDHLRSMGRLGKEAFRGLYLDVKNQLVHDEIVSLGTLTMNLVHPREVFRPAIEHSAVGVILVHNHPSGDPTPSPEDLKVTRQLAQVGRIMDIEVLDHVIVTRESFVSLRRRGLLGKE
jgi:DNA repair protein RadC